MDINEFSERFNLTFDGRITNVRLVEDVDGIGSRIIVISLDCNSFDDPTSGVGLSFEITCANVQESALTVGCVEDIQVLDEHPLLLDYNTPREYLHITSAPDCPEEIVGALYLAHRSVVSDCRPLSHILNPGLEPVGLGLLALLQGGRGMLASGPSAIISALEEAIDGRMQASRNPAHNNMAGKYRVLLLDDAYVICEAVELAEVPAESSRSGP